MNVLLLLSDEHDGRALGCAGHPKVHTPALDRLAARGVRWTRAWTPSPICVPARAALATGRWVHRIGFWDNAHAYDGRVPGWGHALQAAGIPVESVGKLHFRSGDDPTGFDAQHVPMHIAGGVGQVWGSVREPLVHQGPSPLYTEVGAGTSQYNLYDLAVAERAAAWLAARPPGSSPWVLQVGFVAPHFPLVVPQRYLDRFPLAGIPRPKLSPRDGHRQHPWPAAHDGVMHHDAAFADDVARRRAIAAYWGLISFLDDRIALVLAALETAGHQEDTLVIYASDHGENAGARGFWGKSNLYREAAGIPLILAGPGVPAGAMRSEHVNLIDLAPTILDAVGLDPMAAGFDGVSLLPSARGVTVAARPGFSEYHAVGSPSAGFLIADGPWKLHHYVGYPPELFHLDEDPDETSNRADEPICADVVAGLRARLHAVLAPETPDQVDARAKADQRVLIERFGGRAHALATGTPGATPVANG